MTAAAIATEGLTKRFGPLTAVRDLNLQVHAGEVVGFLGPNGAGKTTTIRLLLGFLRPSAGRCQVLGGSLAKQAGLRRRVGYLPGGLKVDRAMTGQQLFGFLGRLRGDGNPTRIAELAERLDLDPTRRFGALSKGNRQKVGLVQAFQHDPDVLLCLGTVSAVRIGWESMIAALGCGLRPASTRTWSRRVSWTRSRVPSAAQG